MTSLTIKVENYLDISLEKVQAVKVKEKKLLIDDIMLLIYLSY